MVLLGLEASLWLPAQHSFPEDQSAPRDPAQVFLVTLSPMQARGNQNPNATPFPGVWALTGGHCASFSEAAICTLRCLDWDFPRDLMSLWSTWFGGRRGNPRNAPSQRGRSWLKLAWRASVRARGCSMTLSPGPLFRNHLTSSVSILHKAQALSWVSCQHVLEVLVTVAVWRASSPAPLTFFTGSVV